LHDLIELPPEAAAGGLNAGLDAFMAQISIIIAAYNAEKELRVLLESLCLSRFKDFEVCVCDDASADATRGVLTSFTSRLPLRVTTNPANRGVTYSRNQALALARGPLLLSLDADVRLEPGSIDRLLASLDANGADVVAGTYSEVPLDPGPMSDYYALFAHHSFLLSGTVNRYNGFNAWCAICSREVMDRAGGFLEFPKGVEVENETLGRRMAAMGLNIRLDPGVALAHHWGGARKVIFRFTSRVYWWIKIFCASDRRFEANLTTGTYAAGTAAFPLATGALLAGHNSPLFLAFAGAALAVWLTAYASFYAFLLKRRGPLFLLWGVFLSTLLSFPVCACAAYSLAEECARFLLGKKPTLDPAIFNGKS